MFVDVEKLLYGSPAIDCAHHTLVSSTLWDLEQPTILTRPAILDFHRRYLALLPPELARALIPWLLPLRRLTFLRTLTWAMRWRALFSSAAPSSPAEQAHLEKLSERLGRILAPETIAQARSEWSRVDRLGPPFDDRLICS